MYKKLLVVGPLLASPSNLRTEEDSTSMEAIRWLDLHPPNSVFYVSFGSEQTLYPWQMTELAKGLEESGRPFIWVLRQPHGLEGEFKSERLPKGFEERVTMGEPSQGLLLKKWAPQVAILSHESTGAFLSHCAWNSLLEGIIHGQPIVCWPMAYEQFSNSMLAVEELGVGVELARKADAKIEASAVTRAMEVVLDGSSEKGKEMRKKAGQLAEIMKAAAVEDEGCKGSSIAAIDKFIELVQKNA